MLTERPCAADGCAGTVEFNTGATSNLGGQPPRSHATCPACGTYQYLTENGAQDTLDEPAPD